MKPVEIYLASYLESLDAQLDDLPPARRMEIIGETREHLEAMMSARRSDGLRENDAWQSARQAFGDAEIIGRELAREWKRAPRVETVGTPLSKREKAQLFARPVLLAGLVFTLLMWSLNIGKVRNYWLNALIAFATLSSVTYGFRGWRRGGGKMSPASAMQWSLILVQLAWANFHMTFGAQLSGTFWSTVSQNFPIVMLPLLLVSSFWLRRETKTSSPWRQMPLYARNPIAAEETYRLVPKIGLTKGVVLGCLLWLWMGWQFFGLWPAVLLCVGEITAAYFYSRWLDKQMR